MTPPDFLSSATHEWLDADRLRRAAVPCSALGLAARDARAPFTQATAAAWCEDVSACGAFAALAANEGHEFRTVDERFSQHLTVIEDPSRAVRRAREGAAAEADLYRLKAFLFHAWHLLRAAAALPAYPSPPLSADACRALLLQLEPDDTPRERFTLSAKFSPELRELRARHTQATRAADDARRALAASLADRCGVRWRSGPLTLAPHHPAVATLRQDAAWTVASERPTGVTFVAAPESAVRRADDHHAALTETLDQLEASLVEQLARGMAPHADAIMAARDWVGMLDFRLARARLAAAWKGTWPRVKAGGAVEITDGTYPLDAGHAWQPVSLRLQRGVTLLTGPNMGGKSTVLRLVASFQLLAQLGYPVSAAAMTFDWVDGVDFVGGELGDSAGGLSSFAGEMVALRDALATPGRRLLLVDELARTTRPTDGRALALATAEFVASPSRETVALMVTHFADFYPTVGAARYSVRGLRDVQDAALSSQAEIVGWQRALSSAMDYALVREDAAPVSSVAPSTGSSAPSDAVRIAALIGLPAALIDAARAHLSPPAVAPSDPST